MRTELRGVVIQGEGDRGGTGQLESSERPKAVNWALRAPAISLVEETITPSALAIVRGAAGDEAWQCCPMNW